MEKKITMETVSYLWDFTRPASTFEVDKVTRFFSVNETGEREHAHAHGLVYDQRGACCMRYDIFSRSTAQVAVYNDDKHAILIRLDTRHQPGV